ncbi:hypothetical protein V8C43DRAFT_304790 [Trichoderma afarasin]
MIDAHEQPESSTAKTEVPISDSVALRNKIDAFIAKEDEAFEIQKKAFIATFRDEIRRPGVTEQAIQDQIFTAEGLVMFHRLRQADRCLRVFAKEDNDRVQKELDAVKNPKVEISPEVKQSLTNTAREFMNTGMPMEMIRSLTIRDMRRNGANEGFLRSVADVILAASAQMETGTGQT